MNHPGKTDVTQLLGRMVRESNNIHSFAKQTGQTWVFELLE
jgi:hypothetical protein